MQAFSVEEQISRLRSTTSFAPHMHQWLLAGAAIGALMAAIFWHPVPLMIAVFLAIVGLSEQQAGPNIVSAISAYDTGTATDGEILVTITLWDTTNSYHATVREAGHSEWKYEFIPQGWQPANRSYPAKIWRNVSDSRPVLALVKEGILIPRYNPVLINNQNDQTGHA